MLLPLLLLPLSTSYQTGGDPCKTGDYKVYPHSTVHKTVQNYAAWNRASKSVCDLHSSVHCYDKEKAEKNRDCGDCDYVLSPEQWYRFSKPNDKIVVIDTESQCPPQGHCNGYYALTLLRSSTSNFFFPVISGRIEKGKAEVCWSNNGDFNKTHMVEITECSDGGILYKFPASLNNKTLCSHEADVTCGADSNETTGTLYTPASWCLTGNTTNPDPEPNPDRIVVPKSDPQKVLSIGLNSAVLVVLLMALTFFVVHKFCIGKGATRVEPQTPPSPLILVNEDLEAVPEAAPEKSDLSNKESETGGGLKRGPEIDPPIPQSRGTPAMSEGPVRQQVQQVPAVEIEDNQSVHCDNDITGKTKFPAVECGSFKVHNGPRGEKGDPRKGRVQTVHHDEPEPQSEVSASVAGDDDLSGARLQKQGADGATRDVRKKRRKKKKVGPSNLEGNSSSDKASLIVPV